MTARGISVLISSVVLLAIVFGVFLVVGSSGADVRSDPWAHVPKHPAPTDHSAFFEGPFEDGPAVTRACLACHPDAAGQVMHTTHWSWAGDEAVDPQTGERHGIGKRNLQNNFCISIAGNWPRCTSCHVGYGWADDTFFESAGPEHVDCLVCHDTSNLYQKEPTGAGAPKQGVDLLAAAKSVGRTTRASCGGCHFKGGGGDGVKHGDLDETMYFPAERVDVHMGRHDLTCTDCHKTEDHAIRGRLLPPARAEATRVRCVDCHGEAPHGEDRLNSHVDTVACQTCHIPEFAAETGTKMWWDWSKAGLAGDAHEIADRLTHEIQQDPAAAERYPPEIHALFAKVGRDPDVWTHYDRKKGLFLIARRQRPEYRWYDMTTKRYLPGEKTTPGETVAINLPQGDARDPHAKIWPFKVHRGRQPYDLENQWILGPHVFGAGGYWKTFDWDDALRSGAEASGVPYSGRRGWVETEMFWPQNHMVQPKERSLGCVDCHGPKGRMDWRELGYPGDPAVQGDRRQMDVVRTAQGGAR